MQETNKLKQLIGLVDICEAESLSLCSEIICVYNICICIGVIKVIFIFNLAAQEGMLRTTKDCLGLRVRINSLHQTWKWLHQTIALHDFLTALTSASKNMFQHCNLN